MRTIKFRGKSLDNGEWVYGHYADYIHPDCGLPSPSIIYPCYNCGNMIIAADPDTVGQFTGLLDHNGKEIYEGDIVLLGDKCKIPYVVEWQKEIAMFIISTQGFVNHGCIGICDTNDFRQVEAFGGCRIIGNIHDNPELIQQQQ